MILLAADFFNIIKIYCNFHRTNTLTVGPTRPVSWFNPQVKWFGPCWRPLTMIEVQLPRNCFDVETACSQCRLTAAKITRPFSFSGSNAFFTIVSMIVGGKLAQVIEFSFSLFILNRPKWLRHFMKTKTMFWTWISNNWQSRTSRLSLGE